MQKTELFYLILSFSHYFLSGSLMLKFVQKLLYVPQGLLSFFCQSNRNFTWEYNFSECRWYFPDILAASCGPTRSYPMRCECRSGVAFPRTHLKKPLFLLSFCLECECHHDHEMEVHPLEMVRILVGRSPRFLKTSWIGAVTPALDCKPPDLPLLRLENLRNHLVWGWRPWRRIQKT